jgi:pimeloyl-ACP methyl ester carboxylesterase
MQRAPQSSTGEYILHKWFVLLTLLLTLLSATVHAETTQTVDIPTRAGVTQRMLVITPEKAKAVLVLFTGGNGALRISPSGDLGMGKGNFLIRTRQQWVDKGFVVAMVDAPSDRQSEPYMSGFRQTPEHATDIKAVIAWLRQNTKLPVWLVGTSRGTQSAAFVTTALDKADGPDGLVLTSSVLTDRKSRSIPDMALEKITIPTLLVHHKQDSCRVCDPGELPDVMSKLSHASRKELIMVEGGITEGDPCEAFAHHGYNGIEPEVVSKIAAWVLAE